MSKIVQPDYIRSLQVDEKYKFALHNNLLSSVSLPSDVDVCKMYKFSKEVTLQCDVTNQKSSGRCWMFAGLNMMRNSFIKKQNLGKSFEFSQSYLFFWDKLERVNYFINAFEKTKQECEVDDRLIQLMLKDALSDGGQWQMFVNLVEKYGIVPKDVFPETTHSSNTAGLNMVLNKLLRQYCKNIRKNSFNKEDAIKEVYTTLVKFLGKPPSLFDWEYTNKDGKYESLYDLSPQKFYRDHVKMDLKQYVSIVHDPRNEYMKLYGVEYLGNVEEGEPVKYFNVSMDKIIELTKKSINNEDPVWFGCDVGQFLHSKSSVMDKKVFDYEQFLGLKFELNKRERLDYGDSLMTHAMVISGYNEDRYGNTDRWKIENSWGKSDANGGYYTMTTEWMKDFVYQIVVHQKYMSEDEKQIWNGKPVKLHPLWDPMGSLANV